MLFHGKIRLRFSFISRLLYYELCCILLYYAVYVGSGGSRGRMRGMHPPTGIHSAPKLAILRSKIEKKILGRGHSLLPRPLSRGEGVPLPPRGLRPPGFDYIPLHQRFLDPPLQHSVRVYNVCRCIVYEFKAEQDLSLIHI